MMGGFPVRRRFPAPRMSEAEYHRSLDGDGPVYGPAAQRPVEPLKLGVYPSKWDSGPRWLGRLNDDDPESCWIGHLLDGETPEQVIELAEQKAKDLGRPIRRVARFAQQPNRWDWPKEAAP